MGVLPEEEKEGVQGPFKDQDGLQSSTLEGMSFSEEEGEEGEEAYSSEVKGGRWVGEGDLEREGERDMDGEREREQEKGSNEERGPAATTVHNSINCCPDCGHCCSYCEHCSPRCRQEYLSRDAFHTPLPDRLKQTKHQDTLKTGNRQGNCSTVPGRGRPMQLIQEGAATVLPYSPSRWLYGSNSSKEPLVFNDPSTSDAVLLIGSQGTPQLGMGELEWHQPRSEVAGEGDIRNSGRGRAGLKTSPLRHGQGQQQQGRQGGVGQASHGWYLEEEETDQSCCHDTGQCSSACREGDSCRGCPPAVEDAGLMRVYVHHTVLQKQSQYFEAQLSGRWALHGSGGSHGEMGAWDDVVAGSDTGDRGMRKSSSSPCLNGEDLLTIAATASNGSSSNKNRGASSNERKVSTCAPEEPCGGGLARRQVQTSLEKRMGQGQGECTGDSSYACDTPASAPHQDAGGPGSSSSGESASGAEDHTREQHPRGRGRGPPGAPMDREGRRLVHLEASEYVSEPGVYFTALRLMYLCHNNRSNSDSSSSSNSKNGDKGRSRLSSAFGSLDLGREPSGSGDESAIPAVQKELILLSSPRVVLDVLGVASQLLAVPLMAQCLDYLESVPWAESDEDNIKMVLRDLQLAQSSDCLGQAVLSRLPAAYVGQAEVKQRVRDLLDRCLRWHPNSGPSSTFSPLDSSTGSMAPLPSSAAGGAHLAPGLVSHSSSSTPSWPLSYSIQGLGTPSSSLPSVGPSGAVLSSLSSSSSSSSSSSDLGDRSELRAAVQWMLRRAWPSGLLPWEAKRDVLEEAFLGLRRSLEAEYTKNAKGGNSNGVFQPRRDGKKLWCESGLAWLLTLMLEPSMLMGDVVFRWLASDVRLVREVKYCCLNAEEPHKLAKTALHGALRAFKDQQVVVRSDVRCSFVKLWFPILIEENAFGENRFLNVRCRSAERDDVVDGFNRLVLTLPAPEQEALFRQWKRRGGRGDNPSSASSSSASSSGNGGSSSTSNSTSMLPSGAASSSSATGAGLHRGQYRPQSRVTGALLSPSSSFSSPFTLRKAYIRWLKRFGEPCSEGMKQ